MKIIKHLSPAQQNHEIKCSYIHSENRIKLLNQLVKSAMYLIYLLLILLIMPLEGAAQDSKFTGNWSGKLDLPGAKIEMIFKITANDTGKLTAKLDVPAQGAMGLPVSGVTAENDSLTLVVGMINGNYKGKISDEKKMEGKWSQNGMSFPLTLSKSDSIPEMKRPQMPQKPYPYIEEEVEYKNANDGAKLAGTLTLPGKTGKYPAVVLITGSGAEDRDETIFGHKPFLIIADYLTRNGIAVLRSDDRGVGGSEGNIRNVTSEDLAVDALAGVEFLKKHNHIDASHIGLIGHSEGGLIAPMAANMSADVAFIVMLAGPGIPGEQILYEQGELINKAAGLSESMIKQNRQLQASIFNIIMNEKDSAKAATRMQQAYSRGMYNALNDQQKKIIDERIKAVNTPWFKYFLEYDPYPTLKKVKCPVLALNGEKDLQVPREDNLAAIKKALTEGGNKNFKVMELPNLNHLFQDCKTGAISEYAQIEETISPEVLKIIKDWILEEVKQFE